MPLLMLRPLLFNWLVGAPTDDAADDDDEVGRDEFSEGSVSK
jgi:hypothetical protein